MAAQLQPIEHTVEDRQPTTPSPRAHSHLRHTKKTRRKPKLRLGLSGWLKWAGTFVAVIGALIAAMVNIKAIFPPMPVPIPTVLADADVLLTRGSTTKQFELRISLTLQNQGGAVAIIPRPTVSSYIQSPDQAINIPAEKLRFTLTDLPSEVIFPVSLCEGANTFQKQIFCLISVGPDGEWYQPGVPLHLNLAFGHAGREPVSCCLVFTSPVPASIADLPENGQKHITISDQCGDFGDGFIRRTSLGGSR